MWLHCTHRKILVLSVITYVHLECEGANEEFNERIRDYAEIDNANLTHISSLQKQSVGLGGYASSAPILNTIKYKEVPDSALSGSSHSRGLLHHDYNGYGYTDYDDHHFGHGYDYPVHDHHHGYGLHGVEHHISGHHLDHHLGHHLDHHGHHFKHYDHALATKTLLWPIAGIALLGAAAALVSNPVLLQLGVVSGKRKRRHTETTDELVKDSIRKWTEKQQIKNEEQKETSQNMMIMKRVLRKTDHKDNNVEISKQSNRKPRKYLQSIYSPSDFGDERNFIPIPLKFKNP